MHYHQQHQQQVQQQQVQQQVQQVQQVQQQQQQAAVVAQAAQAQQAQAAQAAQAQQAQTAQAQAQAAARYQQQRYYYEQHQAHAQQAQAHADQQYRAASLPQTQINTHLIDQRLTNNNNNNNNKLKTNNNTSTHSTPPSNTAKPNNNNNNNSYVAGMLMNNGILSETDPKLASHMDLNELVTNKDESISNNKLTSPEIDNDKLLRNRDINHTSSNSRNSNSSNSSNSSNTSVHSTISINPDTNTNTTTTTNTNTNSTNNNTSAPTTKDNDLKHDFKVDFGFREVSQQNRNIYNYAMNNNPHAMNDPSIQESLSPYFQPFGVDVSHLPMTNPPIFQNSVPLFDEPVRRRRISISNGQISQLGEDIETVENLYNTQPPPMPRFNNHNKVQPNLLQPLPIVPGNENDPTWTGAGAGAGAATANTAATTANVAAATTAPGMYPSNVQQRYGSGIMVSSQPTGSLAPTLPPTSDELTGAMADNGIIIQSQLPISINQNNPPPSQSQVPVSLNQSITQQQQPSSSSLQHLNNNNGSANMMRSNQYIKKEYASSVSSGHSGHSFEDREESTPGTPAWKRARLLERNRVAASKCRQRKKIAQLQLQKDFDILSRENNIAKKKLSYYEKLISKFKKFTQSHFQKCHTSDDFKDLKMIEEMLMIDQDVFEVNENGSILKMADNSYI